MACGRALHSEVVPMSEKPVRSTDGEIPESLAHDYGVFVDPELAKLGKALNFTPRDLAANRAGQLSASQSKRLKRDAIFQSGCSFVFFALIALFFALVGVKSKPYDYVPIFCAFTIFFMLVLLEGRAVLNVKRAYTNCPAENVQTTQVTFSYLPYRYDNLIKFTVDNETEIIARESVRSELKLHQPYLVHYAFLRAENAYHAISMEPVAQPEPEPLPPQPRRSRWLAVVRFILRWFP